MVHDPRVVQRDFAVEFLSPAWFDLYQKVCIAASRLGSIGGVMCEVYRNVPRHLAAEGTIAWTRRTVDGSCVLEFRECADAEATSKIRADYTALLPLARCMIGENDSGFDALIAETIAAGGLEIVRHDPHAPSDHLVHNLMAALTR